MASPGAETSMVISQTAWALLGSGGLLTGVVAWLRSRTEAKRQNDANLWLTIGKLQEKVEKLEAEIVTLRDQRHTLANENTGLKVRVNDLLEELGRPIEYFRDVLLPEHPKTSGTAA